ncbi:zonadhesin-like [Haliotis rubra]|uniref:zonadhesin-like n=1 Tax=Haliotis rubra TaxID=36100 RepID=UPI001EE60EC6|nr:zonadhesin-like [Haliotis rubra]
MQLSEVLCTITLLLSLQDQSVFAQSRKCPKLSLPNGRVKMRARGKFAYFKCKKRYTRLGDRFAVCLQSETWSHPTPICISRGCPSLGALPQMEVEESYNGALLKFTCPIGTKRTGPEVLTCDGREWSEDPPTCDIGYTMECDFEEEGICGWSQDTFDNFEWTRMSGTTPTMSTGPPGDHTTGSGFYLFIESSSPRKAGDAARLISPAYPPTLRNMCFEFWYHMKGPSDDDAVGSLEVYIQPASVNIDEIDPEFYLDGNQGNKWHRGLVKIPDQDEIFKIVIVGTRKEAFVSDIAIDDLRMFNCSEETTTTMPVTTAATTTVVVTSTTADRVTTSRASSTSVSSTRAMMKNVTTEIVPSVKTTLLVPTTAKPVTSSVSSITTTVLTTLQTTPTTASTSTTTTSTSTTTKPTTKRQTSTVRSSTKLSTTTKKPTVKMTSTPVTTTTAPTSTRQQTSSSTSSPVTSVYSFSSETQTNATNANVTVNKGDSPYVTHGLQSTSKRPDDNITSSGDDEPFTGNDSNTSPASVTNNTAATATTSTGSGGVPNVRNSKKNRAGGVMPLIIGISAGIVLGMIVIGILAWLWTRNQRKKKEQEAAEDELNMLTTSDAASYNYN